MKKYIFNIVLSFSCLSTFTFFGQQLSKTKQIEKLPDLAAISYVKKNQIILRWAPGKQDFWKTGNQYGYKVERFLFDDFKSAMDTSTNKKSELINQTPLKPWPQNDVRWASLIKKNKNAALLYNFLYKPAPNANTLNKEIVFGLVLKSCDLYPDIAKANGLFVTDSIFTENEIYVYRISLWDAPKTFKYTPALLTVTAKEKNKLATLKPIKAKFSDKKALISIVTANTEDDFSGFWIERSTDSINYTPVNKAPLVHTTTKFDENKTESIYSDSLPQNNKTFYYRIRGISYFGELSEPSNIVSGKGKTDFTEYPFIDSTTIINNKTVFLKFRMPDKFDLNELKGYAIFRCEKKNGNYTNITATLLAKQAKDFRDEKPQQTNYYKICAVNLNLDSSFSFTGYAKLMDDVPPTIPAGLIGKIDSSGAVTLTWNANTESDLLGYRVFRCNSKKEQPVEITKKILTETKFTDKISLQTLTKEVYYTLRAVDKVYNNSGYSIFCKLIRPDKIPPVSPLFKQVIYTDSSILINWHVSTSNDVVIYKLLKTDQHEDGWRVIKEWQAKDSLKIYTDTSLAIGSRYRYRIEVYDDAKNSSYANSPFVLFQPAFSPKIKMFKATVNLEKRNILLNWENGNNNVYNYTLYKAKGDEPLRVLKTLDAKTTSFTDGELYPNNQYRYTIKATLNNGTESKMSDVVEVSF